MNYLYLLLICFISATLFPLGSEALLIYDLNQGLNLYFLFFIATFGNSMGSIVNYWIGLKGEDYLVQRGILNNKKIEKSKVFFDKYGNYTILLSWVPIIGDPITFIAGALKYDIKRFLILILISKGGRYLFIILSYKLVFPK